MEHTHENVGKYAMLTEDAKWTNYGTPTATLPAGTVVRFIAWKPEGFDAEIVGGGYFFIFKSKVETARQIDSGDTIFFIRQDENVNCVSAYVASGTVAEFNPPGLVIWNERHLRDFVRTEDIFFSRRAALEELVRQSERLLNDVKAELENLDEDPDSYELYRQMKGNER